MIVRHAIRTALRASPHTLRSRLLPQHHALPITRPTPAFATDQNVRSFASSRDADTVMDSLQELYADAKDEFEMAAEETEKKTIYASDDREAAKDVLNTLKEAYQKAVKEARPEVAKEITGRVGQRIRELENAVTAMEERAMHDD